MNKIRVGLIGYGVVGQGVAALIQKGRKEFQTKYHHDFVLKTICDRSIHKKNTRGFSKTKLTTDMREVLDDPDIDVVIELIGGMNPAQQIVTEALKSGKNVVTANKELIANSRNKLFALAQKCQRHVCFESSVGAGVPIIKTITEGLAGNSYHSVYGIINGTCNFILDEMTKKDYTFAQALTEAQKRGYAESDPTLDINGMDSTHKLAILVNLAFGKNVRVKDIYTEGITQISHQDIENAEQLNLCIKLLAIAKKVDNEIEARVHPTLIAKDHPLAAINGIYNAITLKANPMGNILLSGEGAGQMAAASGVISDLINLTAQRDVKSFVGVKDSLLKMRRIDQIKTKFYIRFMATDKPGVLSKITGILGQHGISINSVTQKVHNTSATIPVIMLTDYTSEKELRASLNQIHKLSIVKSKPVAIRMEKLW